MVDSRNLENRTTNQEEFIGEVEAGHLGEKTQVRKHRWEITE